VSLRFGLDPFPVRVCEVAEQRGVTELQGRDSIQLQMI
jgi:hypothetical protein